MLIPALIDLIYMHENYKVFILSSLITAMTGFILVLSVWGKNQLLGLREAFILISLTWLLIAIFSAIPLYISDSGLNITDAFFESMSGIKQLALRLLQT